MSAEYKNSDIVYADSTSATLSAFQLSGAGRMLVVYTSRNFSNTLPTAMTVGGVAMTAVDSTEGYRTYYLGESELPANGTEDIVVTYAASDDIILAAILFTDVKDKAPEASLLDFSQTGGTAFDPNPEVLTSITEGAVVAAFASKRFSEDMTFSHDFGAGTEKEQVLDTASGWAHALVTGEAKDVSFGSTWGTSRDWVCAMLIFEAADADLTVIGPAVIKCPWTKKPPPGTKINMLHPMVKDMFFFCAMNRNGDQVNLIDGRIGVVDTGVTPAETKLIATPYGLVQDFEFADESSWWAFNFGNTGGSGAYEPDELTIITQARPENEAHGGGSRIISKRTVAGGSDDYALYLGSIMSEWKFRVNGNDSSGEIDPPDLTLFNNILFDLALAVDSTSQENFAWTPERGGQRYTGTATGTSVNGSTGDLCLGFRQGEARQFDGTIHYVAMWNIKKDEGFINDFRKNPWQIFEPRKIFIGKPNNEKLVMF